MIIGNGHIFLRKCFEFLQFDVTFELLKGEYHQRQYMWHPIFFAILLTYFFFSYTTDNSYDLRVFCICGDPLASFWYSCIQSRAHRANVGFRQPVRSVPIRAVSLTGENANRVPVDLTKIGLSNSFRYKAPSNLWVFVVTRQYWLEYFFWWNEGQLPPLPMLRRMSKRPCDGGLCDFRMSKILD